MTTSAVTRTRAIICFRQLQELQAVLGNKITAHCIGIQEASLLNPRQYPSTWRAVQFLHTLVFRRGSVDLVDTLTSFAYTPQQVVEPASCGVVTGEITPEFEVEWSDYVI